MIFRAHYKKLPMPLVVVKAMQVSVCLISQPVKTTVEKCHLWAPLRMSSCSALAMMGAMGCRR